MKNSQFITASYPFFFRCALQKWSILFLLMLSIGCSPDRVQNATPHTPPPFDINDIEIMFWQNEEDLWVGNRRGIARLNRNDESLEVFSGLNCSSPVITYDPELIWCNGNIFDGSAWQTTDPDMGRPLQGPDKTIWAGSKSGLARFDVASRSWDDVLSDTSTRWDTSIIFNNPGPGIHLEMITRDGALWFYAYTGEYIGVNRWTGYELLTWPMYGDDSIMIPRFEANDGSVWAVQYPPYQNKMARWNRHRWNHMSPFSEIGFPIFIEARDQTVWIASGSYEVGQWDGEDWQVWSPFPTNVNIVDILEASDETIWIISRQNNVGRWNGQGWQVWNEDEITSPVEAEGKSACLITGSKRIFSSIKDQPHKSEARYITLEKHLVDNSGNIWFILSQQKGIARWAGECWRHYTTADGLSSNDVSVLTVSPDGVLWAGTRGSGINFYNPEMDRWQPFPDY